MTFKRSPYGAIVSLVALGIFVFCAAYSLLHQDWIWLVVGFVGALYEGLATYKRWPWGNFDEPDDLDKTKDLRSTWKDKHLD